MDERKEIKLMNQISKILLTIILSYLGFYNQCWCQNQNQNLIDNGYVWCFADNEFAKIISFEEMTDQFILNDFSGILMKPGESYNGLTELDFVLIELNRGECYNYIYVKNSNNNNPNINILETFGKPVRNGNRVTSDKIEGKFIWINYLSSDGNIYLYDGFLMTKKNGIIIKDLYLNINYFSFSVAKSKCIYCSMSNGLGEFKHCAPDNENKNLSSIEAESDFITDTRDNQTYKTIKIGEIVWMAEDFKYICAGSCCYQNNSNCISRLYDWSAAKKNAPLGWHLPTEKEWMDLINYNGGKTSAYNKLTENGESGFKANFTGCKNPDDTFTGKDTIGFYWSSDKKEFIIGKDQPYYFIFNSIDKIVGENNFSAASYMSVRYVKDK